MEVQRRAGEPGTYFYWASTTGDDIDTRKGIHSQLSGAIIVDSASAAPVSRAAHDRVFVIGVWREEPDTTVQCTSPAICRDSGWGTYGRSDSTLYSSYANKFWDSDGFAPQELGVFRGDTLLIKRTDDMWAPYMFTLKFVYKTSC
jgi:hypothetical protein